MVTVIGRGVARWGGAEGACPPVAAKISFLPRNLKILTRNMGLPPCRKIFAIPGYALASMCNHQPVSTTENRQYSVQTHAGTLPTTEKNRVLAQLIRWMCRTPGHDS